MTATDVTGPQTAPRTARRLAGNLAPRKTVMLLTAASLIAATGGAAYAYWTATGSGSATATAGTTVPVTITGTTSGTIYPGGTFTVTLTANNTNATPVKVGTVSATNFDSDIAGCDTLIANTTNVDFSMADVALNTTLAASTNNIALTSGSLVFANAPENQDACKGAVLTVTLSATAGS